MKYPARMTHPDGQRCSRKTHSRRGSEHDHRSTVGTGARGPTMFTTHGSSSVHYLFKKKLPGILLLIRVSTPISGSSERLTAPTASPVRGTRSHQNRPPFATCQRCPLPRERFTPPCNTPLTAKWRNAYLPCLVLGISQTREKNTYLPFVT